jgi:hypothetical protein
MPGRFDILEHEYSYELQAFLTVADVFDFRFFKYVFFQDDLTQFAIVDMFILHTIGRCSDCARSLSSIELLAGIGNSRKGSSLTMEEEMRLDGERSEYPQCCRGNEDVDIVFGPKYPPEREDPEFIRSRRTN